MTPVDDPRVLQDFVPNDLATFPALCKAYPPGLPTVALPRSWPPGARTRPRPFSPAGSSPPPGTLDLATLARLLHLSAGVVRTVERADGRRYLFRAAGSAGRGASRSTSTSRRAASRAFPTACTGTTRRSRAAARSARRRRARARRSSSRASPGARLALLRARLPPHLLGRRHDAGADARAGGRRPGWTRGCARVFPDAAGDARSSAPTACTSSRSRS